MKDKRTPPRSSLFFKLSMVFLVTAWLALWLTPAGREWMLFAITQGHSSRPKAVPPAEAWRDWDKPTDPRELAAYEHAHSLKLPDGVPQPVPFDFGSHSLSNRKTTAAAYFEHLCKTEAGEYIFKTVDKVEGLYQMRAMPKRTEELLRDRYGFEDPADWSGSDANGDPEFFIGHPTAGFRYFESYRSLTERSTVTHGKYSYAMPWARDWAVLPGVDPDSAPYWRYHKAYYSNGTMTPVYTPGTVTPVAELQSRYAYTWRGIRRKYDREYGIAGGELIVLDHSTGEILGVRRSFAIAKQYHTHLDWEFAYYCPGLLDFYGKRKVRNKIAYPSDFIRQILGAIDFVNPATHQLQGEPK